MSDSAIKIIEKSLKALADRKIPPTVHEAKTASMILGELDKITRLDEGKPTDIVEEKPFDKSEIRRKLNYDPFNEDNVVELVEGGSPRTDDNIEPDDVPGE